MRPIFRFLGCMILVLCLVSSLALAQTATRRPSLPPGTDADSAEAELDSEAQAQAEADDQTQVETETEEQVQPPRVVPLPGRLPRPGLRRPTAPAPPRTNAPRTNGQPSRQPGPQEVALSFKDVDIRVFIQFIAKLTGKTYVVSDKVTGRVTVLTPGPVTVEEAVRIFESVLDVKGFVTVRDSGVVKVVPAREGRWQASQLVKPEDRTAPQVDQMVTQVINLQYASAQDLKRNLRPLAGLHANLAAYDETNTLVITDVGSNVRRLAEIVRTLDRPGSSSVIRVHRLNYANAKDLAEVMTKLFSRTTTRQLGKAPPASVTEAELKVLADERTNSLVLLGTRADIARGIEAAEALDQPSPEGQFNINVIHLRYAVAEEMAKVFNQLAGGSSGTSTVTGQAESSSGQRVPAGFRSPGAGQGGPGEQGVVERVRLLSGNIRVVAEPATNSLIISADPQEFKVIAAIVAKLDIPRTMVYVETVILEVTATKSLEFGVEWNAAGVDGDTLIFGGVGGRPASSVPEAGSANASTGLNLGIIGGSIKFGDIEIPNLSALVRSVQTDSDIRVVATPQILTADNEEATIQVATNLPFVTRVDQGTETTDRAIQVFEYRDVGITLKVTPRISDEQNVRLNVETEAKNVVSAQTTDSSGNVILAPTTNVRTAKTVVQIRDSEIVALGGLINQNSEEKGNQVPCLGSIPLLGWAFKSTSDTSNSTNLLIFLSPHILASAEAIKAFSDEKMKQGRSFMPPDKRDILTPIRPKKPVPRFLMPQEETKPGTEEKKSP